VNALRSCRLALRPAPPAERKPPVRAHGYARPNGFALPLALLLCLALGAIAAGAATHSLLALRDAVGFDTFQRALAVAVAGLERGVEILTSAYEAGAAPPDSADLVAGEDLNGFTYGVSTEAKREPGTLDLNGNGVRGEVVRFARSWGYTAAAASGGPGDEGEPVRRIVSAASAPAAGHRLVLEVGFERDTAVADPRARGAWRAIRLRWSSLEEPTP
jgi:hypothetical protein